MCLKIIYKIWEYFFKTFFAKIFFFGNFSQHYSFENLKLNLLRLTLLKKRCTVHLMRFFSGNFQYSWSLQCIRKETQKQRLNFWLKIECFYWLFYESVPFFLLFNMWPYWNCNLPINPPVRSSVGWLVHRWLVGRSVRLS